MKITFLGTNGWYDTSTGNTICILVETEGHNIVLDAGNGFYKLDRYISYDRPTWLFLSHFHLDHIIGLHILNKFKFKDTFHICGQPGTKEVLGSFVNLPFSMPLGRLGYGTELLELPEDEGRLPFPLVSLPLLHSSFTLGYRFEAEGKVIAYCPDTGYCENAVKLAMGADLLITECAYKPGQSSEGWPHLNPELAAGIAKEAGAKKLALVHFDAAIYTTIEDRMMAEKAARTIFENAFAAMDDMQVEV